MPKEKLRHEDMTLKDLRTALKTYGGKVSGRKHDLIESRLQFYEKNADQVGSSSIERETAMMLPSKSDYKDVHGGMHKHLPQVTIGRISDYLSLFQKKFDTKSKEFYEQRYIQTFRVSNNTKLCYIKANIWAEMKKTTSYEVNCSVDSDGVIQEAQCECGAGMAPTAHCKHVSAMLYGLSEFIHDGCILTELTCTQELMTFHHAKPHTGSPMKTNDLCLVTGKEVGQYSYDPRPQHRRNREGYTDFVPNASINFQGSGNHGNMPVLQMVPPANPYAIGLDHDYCELNYEDYFLKKYMILSITNDQATTIESETRDQANNKKWIEMRTMRLTSSGFGTICKLTERRNIATLCGGILTPKELKTASVEHGRKYEAVAVEKYEEVESVLTDPCGLFISVEKPHLAASPDRLQGDTIVVEVKCPYAARDKLISPTTVGLPYLEFTNNNTLTLKKSHDYFYQIQGQLFCTRRSMGHLIVFTRKDMKIIHVPFDRSLLCDMLNKLTSFYNGYFKKALLEKFLYKQYYRYSFARQYKA